MEEFLDMKSKITFKDIWNKDHILECIVLISSFIMIIISIIGIIYGNILYFTNNWLYSYSIVSHNITYMLRIAVGILYILFTYNSLMYYKTRQDDLIKLIKLYNNIKNDKLM